MFSFSPAFSRFITRANNGESDPSTGTNVRSGNWCPNFLLGISKSQLGELHMSFKVILKEGVFMSGIFLDKRTEDWVCEKSFVPCQL